MSSEKPNLQTQTDTDSLPAKDASGRHPPRLRILAVIDHSRLSSPPQVIQPGDFTGVPSVSPFNQVIEPGDFTRVPLTLAAHAQCLPWQVPG